MITVQFQAREAYRQNDEDQKKVEELFQYFADKYPRLFEGRDVIADVTASSDSSTMAKQLQVVATIPKHGKVVSEAEEQTFAQAISSIKTDFDRACRELMRA